MIQWIYTKARRSFLNVSRCRCVLFHDQAYYKWHLPIFVAHPRGGYLVWSWIRIHPSYTHIVLRLTYLLLQTSALCDQKPTWGWGFSQKGACTVLLMITIVFVAF